MRSDDAQNYRRIFSYISKEDYINFKGKAAQKFEWRPGYTEKSIRQAIWVWICYEDVLAGRIDRVLEILKKKHPELKTRRELVREGIRESVELFLKENE